MKKTFLTLLTVLGCGVFASAQNYTAATPYVDASVTPGVVSTFDVIVANDAVVEALKTAGQTVNDIRGTGQMYIWDNTFIGAESTYAGVGYTAGAPGSSYLSLDVSTIGWSGAGYSYPNGTPTTGWNDNSRLHVAYRTNNSIASVAVILGGDSPNPAKVALGSNFIDNGATYPSVAPAATSEWQALDISFAELKSVYPSFSYTSADVWNGNLFSFLGGGAAGNNICFDAVYIYTPGEKATGSNPVISPAPGNIANGLDDITLLWDGCTVALNDNAPAISVLYNGEAPFEEPYVYLVDADGERIYEDNDSPAAGIGIMPPYFWSEDGSLDYTAVFTVPAGFLTVTSADGTAAANEAVNFSYNVFHVSDEYICNPPKGSKISSLKSFTFQWADYKMTKNPACTDEITYNYEPVESVTVTNNVATITLPEEYATNGWLYFTIPQGYFLLEGDNTGVFESPANYDISYNISVYSTDPGDYGYFYEPFTSFTIYGESIALAGNISDIVMTDDYGTEIQKASSYKAVSEDGTTGFEISFATPMTGWQSVIVTIPAGTLSFGGKVYDSNIDINYFIRMVPDPTAIPADGSTVKQLKRLVLNWENSPLSLTEIETAPTISLPGGQSANIGNYVSIENVMGEGPYGPYVESSKVVIEFPEAYTAAGEYTITIPEGYLSAETFEYAENQEVKIKYTVNPSATSFMEEATTIETYPEFIPSMGQLALTWNDSPITVANNAAATLLYTANDGTSRTLSLPIIGFYNAPNQEGGPAMSAAKAEAADAPADNAAFVDMPMELFGQAGTYAYTIPSGIVSDANLSINPEQKFTFTVIPTTTIVPTVTPAITIDEYGMGTAAVEELPEVTLSWGGKDIDLQSGDITVNGTPLDEFLIYLEDNKLCLYTMWLTFDPGEYIISIPAGKVVIEGSSLSQELTLTYKVALPDYLDYGTLAEPTPTYKNSMDQFTVTWDMVEITVEEDATALVEFTPAGQTESEYFYVPVKGVDLTPQEGEPGIATLDDAPVYNALEVASVLDAIDLENEFKYFQAVGKYVYTIEEGTVSTADGEINREQSFTFYVVPTTTVEPTFTPAVTNYGQATVETLPEVKIAWGNASILVQDGKFRVNETNLSGDEISTDENALVLDVSKYTESAGEYEIVVGANAVLIGGEAVNAEIFVTYITTQDSFVEFVEAESDGLYRVYNFNGINVLTTKNADDLKNLDNGLYIINGKKVILNR